MAYEDDILITPYAIFIITFRCFLTYITVQRKSDDFSKRPRIKSPVKPFTSQASGEIIQFLTHTK